MPYFLKTYNKTLVYHLCPKNACTTVAHMLIQADGNGYVNDKHKDFYNVHYLSKPNNNYEYWTYCDAEIRLAIKRDPVKRFVSGYQNRILYHNDLNKDTYFDKELEKDFKAWPTYNRSEDKTINEFIQNFDKYWENPWVQGHFKSQTTFLGKQDYYTHIFDISELDKVRELLSEVSGKEIILPCLQTGGDDIEFPITDENIKWIKEKYAIDYENGWC